MEDKLRGGSSKSTASDRFTGNWSWGKREKKERDFIIVWTICDVFLKCIQQIRTDQESWGPRYVWETELFWHAQGAGMCNDYQVSVFAVPPSLSTHTPNNNVWSAPHHSQMCPWIKRKCPLTSLPLGACFPILFQEIAFLTLTPVAPHWIDADLRARGRVFVRTFVDVCVWQW